MPQSHAYYFTKRKENKDLPSLKSRNTESKEEINVQNKNRQGLFFNELSGTHVQSLKYKFAARLHLFCLRTTLFKSS